MPIVIDRIVGWTLAANLGFMTSLVFVSVLFRYVLNRPLAWTEELASLLFAWLTIMILFPPAVRRTIGNCVDLCVLALLALFIWQGFMLTRTTWSLEFPALEISRGYLYVSLPIGACLMVLAILLARRDADAAEQKKDWV
jgi:TRAP-type C4-dicarboxylate transport system permease small subunit